MSYSFQNWCDRFGHQVSKIREAQTGLVTLLYNSEIEAIEGMEDALFGCFIERVTPRDAARRYLALRGEL